VGAEYQVSEKVNWGAGFKYQPVRRDQDDMSDTDFKNDMLWLATGVDLAFTEELTGVATIELGFATSEYYYYMEDGTTLLRSYKDNLNKSATLGLVYSF
jgi:long-subunit fatty acid transport protein